MNSEIFIGNTCAVCGSDDLHNCLIDDVEMVQSQFSMASAQAVVVINDAATIAHCCLGRIEFIIEVLKKGADLDGREHTATAACFEGLSDGIKNVAEAVKTLGQVVQAQALCPMADKGEQAVTFNQVREAIDRAPLPTFNTAQGLFLYYGNMKEAGEEVVRERTGANEQ